MLYSQRLTLRAIEREDLPRYHQWFNDPEVRQNTSAFAPISMDAETDWYEQQRKDTSTYNFAMVITAEDRHIGTVSLKSIKYPVRSAELGLAIGDKSQWGQGYAQEALRTVVQFGFDELNLHRIWLRVVATHARAIHCYVKCGFKEEGRLRGAHYGQGRQNDLLIMSILHPEYASDKT